MGFETIRLNENTKGLGVVKSEYRKKVFIDLSFRYWKSTSLGRWGGTRKQAEEEVGRGIGKKNNFVLEASRR